MQPLARKAPERLVGLFFSTSSIRESGRAWLPPDRLNENLVSVFSNQMRMAPALVGRFAGDLPRYISHFLRHWAYRKNAFDDVAFAFIETS